MAYGIPVSFVGLEREPPLRMLQAVANGGLRVLRRTRAIHRL